MKCAPLMPSPPGRELFPNSDFLKLKDRIPTLMQELVLRVIPSTSKG